MPVDVRTLPEPRDLRRVHRDQRVRLAGMLVLALLLLAGLTGWLGVRSGSVTATSGQTRLTVDYPAVSRAALASPFRIEVRRPGGFPRGLVVSVPRALFDHLDFNNLYPNPSDETVAARDVRWTFPPPVGDAFHLDFDVRMAPNQTGSVNRFPVRVLAPDGQVLVSATFTMVVMP